MKILLIIIAVVLVLAVLVYSWMNRDSDRVVLTMITALMIGALGFITKESISNKVEETTVDFPIVTFFGLPNYQPLNIKLPYSHYLKMCVQEILPTDIPNNTNGSVDIGFAADKYFDAMQVVIMWTIFDRFSRSWDVEAKRINSPGGTALSWHNNLLEGTNVDIVKFLNNNMPNNYFVKLDIHKNLPKLASENLVIPPDTEIKFEEETGGANYVISLNNKFISIDIKVSKSRSSVGIGEYSALLGLSAFSAPIIASSPQPTGHAMFLLEMKTKQNFWLNGHPEMKRNRNWADSITQLLDSTFNYDSVREEHLRKFQLFGPKAITIL